MNRNILQITVDYRDGFLYLNGRRYPAGHFAVHLLNQYHVKQTGGRFIAFRYQLHPVQDSIRKGYLYEPDYLKAREYILHMLRALRRIHPYDTLDIDLEEERINYLFSTEVEQQITEYWQRRSIIQNIDLGRKIYDHMPDAYDADFFERTAHILDEVIDTLNFYTEFGGHIYNSFTQLEAFVRDIDTVERLDEGHLLPYALKIFDYEPMPMKTEFVRIKKNARSSSAVTARRLYFDNYYSFVITDFFEGLHYGHYPRQCEICEKYFLMTSARRQKYCSGKAPEKLNGKFVSCRKYAAAMNRKELAIDDPIASLYNKRCTAIRTEKSRGTITAEFAECAKALAKEHKYRAYEDDDYANTQYAADMERTKLYADTDLRLQS